MNTLEINKKKMEENPNETALIVKEETALMKRKKFDIVPILKTVTGVIFYTATFIVSVAIGYLFVFSIFQY